MATRIGATISQGWPLPDVCRLGRRLVGYDTEENCSSLPRRSHFGYRRSDDHDVIPAVLTTVTCSAAGQKRGSFNPKASCITDVTNRIRRLSKSTGHHRRHICDVIGIEFLEFNFYLFSVLER
ncbi:hypothetical protein OSTOST_23446 [Ostertagia ostertagi]